MHCPLRIPPCPVSVTLFHGFECGQRKGDVDQFAGGLSSVVEPMFKVRVNQHHASSAELLLIGSLGECDASMNNDGALSVIMAMEGNDHQGGKPIGCCELLVPHSKVVSNWRPDADFEDWWPRIL